MKSYNAAKKLFKLTFKQIINEGDSYEIGEAAFPAYAHSNPLIDYLFWERIKVSLKYAQKQNNSKNVLDFGCGSGILSYILAKEGYNVISCDIEFKPLKLIQEKINFPKGIKFIEGDILDKGISKNSVDIIFALDVLEHIDNLVPYIKFFDEILSPEGVIIISGPTENSLYKIGRKIAGSRFTGDYHVSNISTIKEQFQSYFIDTYSKKLVFPLVLFEVFAAKSKSST